MTSYTLKPRLPMRAFVLAALLSILGAGLVVVAASQNWAGWAVGIGIFIIALGVCAVLLAVGSLRTNRVQIDLDEQGYHIHGAGLDKRGQWRTVTKASVADDGGRLILSHGEVSRTHIWCPMGGTDPQMQALIVEVADRLDASRGYRNLV